MKRLIEEDFPIFEVSRESAREKSIRHGHISTLHIWWARRPLAACRAAIFASLVPDPGTLTEQIPEYIDFLLGILPKAPKEKENEWPNMQARKRLVKFTADISPWEASTNQKLLNKARKTIEVGTAVIKGLRGKELKEVIEGKRKVEMPKVLDPFAGGGSIPLEALRLGCQAYAVEYNPVAVLILKATLEYPQKYGEKLVKDVEKWGKWVLEEARKEIGQFYPEEGDPNGKPLFGSEKKGGWVPVGYIWARTIQCQNPACGAEIPLMKQFWLRRKEDSEGRTIWNDSVYLHPVVGRERNRVDFEVIRGRQINGFDPNKGTRPTSNARSTFACPLCGATFKSKDLQKHAQSSGFGERMICVILRAPNTKGKMYRPALSFDKEVFDMAKGWLRERERHWSGDLSLIPDEAMDTSDPTTLAGRGYGIKQWREMFNTRQTCALVCFCQKIWDAYEQILESESVEYTTALITMLAIILDRVADYNSKGSRWVSGEFIGNSLTRQALPVVWDYMESNPFSGSTGDWRSAAGWVERVLEHLLVTGNEGEVVNGSAVQLSWSPNWFEAIITDPPYYDNISYAILSDFFYIWLKRSIGQAHPDLLSTPLSPKSEEIIQSESRHESRKEAKEFYKNMMAKALSEQHRVVANNGVIALVFAHKTTEAWEALVEALLRSKVVPTCSWPVHTEREARTVARESAALASSFFLACRKREGNETVYFKDIKQELNKRIMERLDHFWEQGIRGADFFISAIGPAVEVFGRYEKVKKLSGEEITASELLEEVRKLVTQYALSRILRGAKLEKIDSLSRFYILWRWTYNGETVLYDDARKLAQAVGIELDDIRGKGKLVSGKDKILVAKPDERKLEDIAKRQPISLIDALHKACLLWKADKRKELENFLSESGFLDDDAFWETAQDLSDLLPDGDREKQMLQGLLMKAPIMPKKPEKQLSLNKEWLK